MGFFDNESVQEIAQNHINEIKGLEDSEAKRLLVKYKEIRQELRDRLDSLPGDTFTAQQLRGVLVQIDAALNAMGDGMKRDLDESSQKAAIRGSEHIIHETQEYSRIFEGAVSNLNLDAILIASDSQNFLFNRQEASIDAYTEGVRATLSRGLSNAVIEKVSLSTATNRLSKFFLGEEWKLQRLARTELHHVYNMSKQNGLFRIAQEDKKLMKGLIHAMDNRTGEDSKAMAEENQVVPVDKPFVQVFNGKRRVYMVPPDRPNDRSILVPYKKSWDF